MGEYLRGIDGNVRGAFYTNRAGAQFLYVTQSPNSSVPDSMLDYPGFCQPGTSAPLQNLPCTSDNGNGFGGNNYVASRSLHPGGVNALFCDGHVAFISNSVALTTWQNLAWIADGNVLGDF
jgi:prepilin-type processing-associated H-X9-DG protein